MVKKILTEGVRENSGWELDGKGMDKEIGLHWLRQSMRQLTNNTDPDPWCVIICHDNVRRQNRMQTRASHDETSIENP